MASEIEPIAIVGLECVFPGASNLAAFWRNIVRGTNCLTVIPPDRWNRVAAREVPHVPGGFIDGFTDFDPATVDALFAEGADGNPEQLLLLSVIDAALRNMRSGSAGNGTSIASPENTEIVIGREACAFNGPQQIYLRREAIDEAVDLLREILPAGSNGIADEIGKQLQAGVGPITPNLVDCPLPNPTAGRAANRLNMIGRNYTVDAACASSLIAVDYVVRSLRERRTDLGIAVGMHINHEPTFWMSFHAIGALSRSGECRPFAQDADGLLIGEGIGAVVLKRLSDALRDRDRIYAAIRGVGIADDGRGDAIQTPGLEGRCLAMRRAYAESGVDPQRVRLIEGDGTATPAGDSTEIDALHAVFGREGDSIALGSVKSMVGHAMAAAGMASLIKAALAIYHRLLPPSCNVERAHPELADSRFCVNTSARPWVSAPDVPRTAGVNAFGFGGINTHAILEGIEENQPWRSLTPQSSELFLISAESPALLAVALAHWHTAVVGLRDEELAACCLTASASFSDAHPVRLAVVAKDAADLAAKLEHIQSTLANTPGVEVHGTSGVYYATSRYAGKLAVVFPGIAFPGLAGGYAARLGELYLHFPEIRRNLDRLDALSHDDPNPQSFSYQLFPPKLLDAKTLQKIDLELAWSKRSPMGMTMANLASWHLLRSLGIEPDMLAGFSLGELSSLIAAEVIDPSFELETLKPLGKVMEEELGGPSDGANALVAMVGTSSERGEAILQSIPGDVSVTIDVSDSQIFIGGETAAVRRALEKFKDAGIWGQALPAFPLLRPYLTVHTERAAPIKAKAREMIEVIPVGLSKYPVYSGTTATIYPQDPDGIREMMLAGVVQPVRFRNTIARLYDDGARIFVQLGAGGKMRASVENALTGSDYVSLSSDVEHRGGLEQLHHLLGRLVMLGRRFDPARLYRYRDLTPLDSGTAAPSTVRTLSLKSPRLRFPAETIERLRAQLAVPAPEPLGTRADSSITGGGLRLTVVGQSAAMMEQFLEVQREWERTEAQLLAQSLDTQAAMLAAVMQMQPQATPDTRAPPPFLGEIQSITPGKELESRLLLDLRRHPFLNHHALLNIPNDLKPIEERLATLPLTFEIEILSEAAEALMPGFLVTACHSMEAMRWVSLESSATLELTVRAKAVADGEVEVELYASGHNTPAFRGRARMGVSLPPPPQPLAQVYEQRCPHTPSEFYAQGPFFHGPMFQLLRTFFGMSETCIGAELEAGGEEAYLGQSGQGLIFEPVLLDALQHIVGYRGWLDGWFLMPVGMKRITRFGPIPQAGSRMLASVHYRKLDGRRVEADYEAYDDAGRPWIRVDGLQAWRVISPKVLLEANHRPREGDLARPWPLHLTGVLCYRVTKDDMGDLPSDWIARLYLRPEEWATYQRRPALDWLLGRVAAKDAARSWLRQHKGVLLHPLEVEICNQPDGAPRLKIPSISSLAISIAHIENEAIAVAAETAKLGVDLAELKERTPGFTDIAFQRDELNSFPIERRDMWIHRGWCAKEACAKAVRLGLGALPQFRVVSLDVTSGAIQIEFRGSFMTVATWQEGKRTIAVVAGDTHHAEDVERAQMSTDRVPDLAAVVSLSRTEMVRIDP
jgi:acyl transferase domain-containing protein/phosphopantetheinyl transferase (holo-ACP synthase)